MMSVRHSRWVSYWLALSYLVAGWGSLLHTHASGHSGQEMSASPVAGCCGACPRSAEHGQHAAQAPHCHTSHQHGPHASHAHPDRPAADHQALCTASGTGNDQARDREPGIYPTDTPHGCTGCVICHFLSQTGTAAGFQVVLDGAWLVDYRQDGEARLSPAPHQRSCRVRGPPLSAVEELV
jgi:hypothetical protein